MVRRGNLPDKMADTVPLKVRQKAKKIYQEWESQVVY
jgi:hypothetical protein